MLTYSVPLSCDVLGGDGGVRVNSRELDAVSLSNLQDLVVDAQRGHALLVSLRQSGLELVVSGDQALSEKGQVAFKRGIGCFSEVDVVLVTVPFVLPESPQCCGR